MHLDIDAPSEQIGKLRLELHHHAGGSSRELPLELPRHVMRFDTAGVSCETRVHTSRSKQSAYQLNTVPNHHHHE